jgi:hypothetical protein
MPRTPAQVRRDIAAVLPLDLIGPGPGHPLENEILPQAPSRWYLTGFLVPYEAGEDQRSDPTSQEEIASGAEGGGTDDDEVPERASARRAYFPSSMGISVLVPKAAWALDVAVTWGDYQAPGPADGEGTEGASRAGWQRTQHVQRVAVDVTRAGKPIDVPGGRGLQLVVSVRAVAAHALELVPEGARVVSVFLVNHRDPSADARRDESFAFQAGLTLACAEGFCPRPNLRGRDGEDWDDQVADVQYRGVFEHAVGHGVATHAHVDDNGACHAVETTWIPLAEVEKVVPGDVGPDVELGMEALAEVASPEALAPKLSPLVDAYRAWIGRQRGAEVGHSTRKAVVVELCRRASGVADRMAEGIALLGKDPLAFDAFRIANRAMARQARRRNKDFEGTGRAPAWRPFQLAFLLLNLRGMIEPGSFDRETVDLLFFPSGPEEGGTASRDTSVVVRELFAEAQRSVLVAGFAVYQGRSVFRVLADRMDADAGLTVTMFLNVERPPHNTSAEAEIVKGFAERFRKREWPGQRVPAVYYDPRAVEPMERGKKRSSLHAKCILVDDVRALVTSANFTEAAQERNIEVGALIESESYTLALRSQFDGLVAAGRLTRVPGL